MPEQVSLRCNKEDDGLPANNIVGNLRGSKERLRPEGQDGHMQSNAVPTAEMTVDEVMRRWPSTIRVFLDFRMRCVGCPIAAFHSIVEACEEHGVDVDAFWPKILDASKAAA